jgi:ParB family chromosome partitioning protein
MSKALDKYQIQSNTMEPSGKERASGPPKSAPAMAMSSIKLNEEIAALKERLAQAEQGNSLEISTKELNEVAGRRRKLSEEEYIELRENLRNNEMVQPVRVRRRAAGGYEIISGHNRVAIYRELGRETIPCYIKDTDDDQADISAFYANLLQTDLTDYEKYLGFRMIQEKFPDMTQAEIAQRSGKSQSFVSTLMSFADLPDEALSIINASPAIIGANATHALATLAKKGFPDDVVKAVQQLAEGKIDQRQAVSFASKASAPQQPSAAKPAPIKIKTGKSTYCDMRRSEKILRIDFKSAEEAAAAEEVVRQVLESLAKQQNTHK